MDKKSLQGISWQEFTWDRNRIGFRFAPILGGGICVETSLGTFFRTSFNPLEQWGIDQAELGVVHCFVSP